MTLTELPTLAEQMPASKVQLPARELMIGLAAADCTRGTDLSKQVLTTWQVKIGPDLTSCLQVVTTNAHALTTVLVDLPYNMKPFEWLIGADHHCKKPTKLSELAFYDKGNQNPQNLMFDDVEGIGVTVTLKNGAVIILPRSSSEFPNYQTLFKDLKHEITGEKVYLNPRYLDIPTKSQAAVKKVTGHDCSHNPVEVLAMSADKPTLFRWRDLDLGLLVTHLIMPFRAPSTRSQ